MDDRIRISDADREGVTARLRDHFAEGRLTREELDERVAAALNARTVGDLRRVMADLPEPALGLQQARTLPRPVLIRRGPPLLPLAALVRYSPRPGSGDGCAATGSRSTSTTSPGAGQADTSSTRPGRPSRAAASAAGMNITAPP